MDPVFAMAESDSVCGGEKGRCGIGDGGAGWHSEKPSCVFEMIEKMYPELPKLEMFSRAATSGGSPPGWDVWGNEAAFAAAV